jgi:hypothetical protein
VGRHLIRMEGTRSEVYDSGFWPGFMQCTATTNEYPLCQSLEQTRRHDRSDMCEPAAQPGYTELILVERGQIRVNDGRNIGDERPLISAPARVPSPVKTQQLVFLTHDHQTITAAALQGCVGERHPAAVHRQYIPCGNVQIRMKVELVLLASCEPSDLVSSDVFAQMIRKGKKALHREEVL